MKTTPAAHDPRKSGKVPGPSAASSVDTAPTEAAAIEAPSLPADCYAASDRGWMSLWQDFRARTLGPALRLLSRARITPDGVTAAGLVVGLAFWPLFGVSPALASAALLLHVALDGLDGPLARFRGTASRSGSFTDTVCDQLVLTGTSAALAVHGELSPALAVVWVFFYAVVVVFSMLRNAMGVPYTLVLRPRFLLYAAIPLEVWVVDGLLDVLVGVLLLPLAWAMWSGFRAVRRNL